MTAGLYYSVALGIALVSVVVAALLRARGWSDTDVTPIWGIGILGSVVWPLSVAMGLLALALIGIYRATFTAAIWFMGRAKRLALAQARREAELRAARQAPVKGGYR